MRRFRSALVAVALLAVASGCGGASDEAGTTSAARGLPAIEVTDLATGGPVQLTTVADADRPTLVWFWAPF